MSNEDKNGICLISIPKSGTMFVSRSLEKLTATPVVFGLDPAGESGLAAQLAQGFHPEIAAALRRGSPGIETMARRFAQMLARNRTGGAVRPAIVSDHGFHSFLRFLINPHRDDIRAPEEIIEWAERRALAPVYLYRDIRGVANSLAHFLASGKSFLLDIDTLEHAARLVAERYVPVLAQQMRQWQAASADRRVLAVAYEDVTKDPAHWLGAICAHGNLAFEPAALIADADAYRSWTYRGNKTPWRQTFTAAQQESLASFTAGAAA
jgi:hypothetical protein